jgi:hypothetical protein
LTPPVIELPAGAVHVYVNPAGFEVKLITLLVQVTEADVPAVGTGAVVFCETTTVAGAELHPATFTVNENVPGVLTVGF